MSKKAQQVLAKEVLDKSMQLFWHYSRFIRSRDFDFSLYFDVIRYPIFKLGKEVSRKDLPWRKKTMSDDNEQGYRYP